jgi:hypothetical protein
LITRTLPILVNIKQVFNTVTTILTANYISQFQLLEWLASYVISMLHNRKQLSITVRIDFRSIEECQY